MLHDGTGYYRQRAVTHRAMALASERKNVREVHEELARQYEALAQNAEIRPISLTALPAAGGRAAGVLVTRALGR